MNVSFYKRSVSIIEWGTKMDHIKAFPEGESWHPCKSKHFNKAFENIEKVVWEAFHQGEMEGSTHKKIIKQNLSYANFSSHRRPCMLSKLSLMQLHWNNNQYLLLIVAPFHTLHLSILNGLETCTVFKYSSTKTPIIGALWTKYPRKRGSNLLALLKTVNCLIYR